METKKPVAEQITLAEICKTLKIEPRIARRILRKSDIQVDSARWVWKKGSPAATTVINLLKERTKK
jgi:hypothetical protein